MRVLRLEALQPPEVLMNWSWPLSATPLFPDAPGQFGSERLEDIHTGVDLYCELGTEVRAVEDGEVVAIEWLTGQYVPTPDGVPSTWWNDTKIILIKGASGVVGYGECAPLEGIVVGSQVRQGQRIALVESAVLKSFKGRPMVMLHIELYRELQVQPDGTHTVWWKLGEDKPANLVDRSPEECGLHLHPFLQPRVLHRAGLPRLQRPEQAGSMVGCVGRGLGAPSRAAKCSRGFDRPRAQRQQRSTPAAPS